MEKKEVWTISKTIHYGDDEEYFSTNIYKDYETAKAWFDFEKEEIRKYFEQFGDCIHFEDNEFSFVGSYNDGEMSCMIEIECRTVIDTMPEDGFVCG